MLGCSIESSWKLVQCLKDGRSFLELGNSELKPHVGMFPWAPVLDINFTVPQDDWFEDWRASDWRFFTETPEQSIKTNKFKKDLVYMAGVTTQEAAYIISMLFVILCIFRLCFALYNFTISLIYNPHIAQEITSL